MQLRFFTVPLLGGESVIDELNRFLASHRILAVDRQLGQDGSTSVWAICVSYEPAGGEGAPPPRRGKVDYKEVLSEADFAVYAELRTLRKEIAERAGVPPYALFTNEQIAEMVTRRASTLSDLREIPGIGAARIDKYGQPFLDALASARARSETDAEPDTVADGRGGPDEA
jgi:superfamily II DNA helicase RecQ